MIFNTIILEIDKANNIIIFPHVSADGDAICSCLALSIVLKTMGKNVEILLEEEMPEYLKFLPERELIKVYNNEKIDFDLAIAVDTGDLERLGKRGDLYKSASKTINMDHHYTNTQFADLNYVSATSAASGEIIFDLIKEMNIKITKDIATCLYVAIVTDTGGFKYSNTTPLTHNIVAKLLESGVNIVEVSQKIFDTTTLSKIQLLGKAIDSLELHFDGKVVVIALNSEVFEELGVKEEDTAGIVNIIRGINTVEVAVMMRGLKNEGYKVSLRSKNYVDVGAISYSFSGGGHLRAAGCTLKGTLGEAKELLLNKIKEAL